MNCGTILTRVHKSEVKREILGENTQFRQDYKRAGDQTLFWTHGTSFLFKPTRCYRVYVASWNAKSWMSDDPWSWTFQLCVNFKIQDLTNGCHFPLVSKNKQSTCTPWPVNFSQFYSVHWFSIWLWFVLRKTWSTGSSPGFSHSSVVRASDRFTEGRVFNSCWGLGFSYCPTLVTSWILFLNKDGIIYSVRHECGIKKKSE